MIYTSCASCDFNIDLAIDRAERTKGIYISIRKQWRIQLDYWGEELVGRGRTQVWSHKSKLLSHTSQIHMGFLSLIVVYYLFQKIILHVPYLCPKQTSLTLTKFFIQIINVFWLRTKRSADWIPCGGICLPRFKSSTWHSFSEVDDMPVEWLGLGKKCILIKICYMHGLIQLK